MAVHWLKIDGLWGMPRTLKAWENLAKYLRNYPDSKITVYSSDINLFHRFFRLSCKQSYQDLDLDCNSMFTGSLIRLSRKPNYLIRNPEEFWQLYDLVTRDRRVIAQ